MSKNVGPGSLSRRATPKADDSAIESRRYRGGLLTYALTHDAFDDKHADLRPVDGRITLREWLAYGAARVPALRLDPARKHPMPQRTSLRLAATLTLALFCLCMGIVAPRAHAQEAGKAPPDPAREKREADLLLAADQAAATLDLSDAGPATAGFVDNLYLLASFYQKRGRYKSAEPLYLRAAAIQSKTLSWGKAMPDMVLDALAKLYESEQRYDEAEARFKAAAEFSKSQYGEDHPYTATALSNLAHLHMSLGRYDEAKTLFLQALKIRTDEKPPNPSETFNIVNNVATAYQALGLYSEAEGYYQQASALVESLSPPNADQALAAANNLGTFYELTGFYADAERSFLHALEICERHPGVAEYPVAAANNNLGTLYRMTGDLARAKSCYLRGIEILEKPGPHGVLATAQAYNNLGVVYKLIADYVQAESLYRKALDLVAHGPNPNDPESIVFLNNLGELYQATGEPKKALVCFEQAFDLATKLGPRHPRLLTTLNKLAVVLQHAGRDADAERALQYALSVREEVFGKDHPSTAISIADFGVFYANQGDFPRARAMLEQALQIDEKALGDTHPETAIKLRNLAKVCLEQGDGPAAERFADRAATADEKVLGNVLSFTSEQQRLAYQSTLDPFLLPAAVGRPAALARAILRYKGIVLDSLLEDHRVAAASKDPAQRDAVRRLQFIKERYTHLLMEAPAKMAADERPRREAEREDCAREIERIEDGLARQVGGVGGTRHALEVTVEQVQQALAPGEKLVEFVRYPRWFDRGRVEPWYGAMIFAADGEPKWVPLAAAADLDQQVTVYGLAVRGAKDEKTLHDVLRGLYRQVWLPLAADLPDVGKTVYLCPDGELNFVSFATLLDANDHFLIERQTLCYMASGRDLLGKGAAATTSPTMVLFGNPAFAAEPAPADPPMDAAGSVPADSRGELSRLAQLGPLAGAEQECADLVKLAEAAGVPHEFYLGTSATEARLRAVKAPRLLLLATHGFFLPEMIGASPVEQASQYESSGANPPTGRVRLQNPMYRSGLALAGAQRTLEAWTLGQVPPPENDGIVTAEEVAALDLRGTWLVVLSACDTGLGEARTSEGVLGLRRGFVEAGTRNLLMTLWSIYDKVTPELMKEFYAEAQASNDPPRALANVQRRWLVKLARQPADGPATAEDSTARHMVTADEEAVAQGGSLLKAVRSAGPFIVSAFGKP